MFVVYVLRDHSMDNRELSESRDGVLHTHRNEYLAYASDVAIGRGFSYQLNRYITFIHYSSLCASYTAHSTGISRRIQSRMSNTG